MNVGNVAHSMNPYLGTYKSASKAQVSNFQSTMSAVETASKSLQLHASQTENRAELVKLFEDSHKLTAQDLKEEKDWREMTDEEWDKMLEGIDKYIDAFKERLRQMQEMQEEAAQKAALEADSDMRTAAASSAALNVAASGLGGATEIEAENSSDDDLPSIDGEKHEKNWTKNLDTDNQTVLRTAKKAQEMEAMAQGRIEEIVNNYSRKDKYGFRNKFRISID